MKSSEGSSAQRLQLSRAQQNIYHGVLQDDDPSLYLIGRRYRFQPIPSAEFLDALRNTILASPIQLCVLEAAPGADEYPNLVVRLNPDDIVQVRGEDDGAVLSHEWKAGILQKPLARYTVHVDNHGLVHGLDAHAHHILLDGGAIGIIEAHLARFLAGDGSPDTPGVGAGLAAVATAHQREATCIDESLQRLTSVVQQELTAIAANGGPGRDAQSLPASAATGVLCESVVITGDDYDDVLALADRKSVPVNVLVAAAATAVDASARQTTESLLVHAVDNRFGDPDLGVATCLVNSIAQPVRFSPQASVADVVRAVDQGYVKAGRRRWLREEHYRRMYLAIHRTTSVETLTLNFLREPCAPELAPFLTDAPVTSHIGPVEGMTVAAVLDEQRRVLTLNIWNRADLPRQQTAAVAARVAMALTAMTTMWVQPIAMTVDEWRGIADDGTLQQISREPGPEVPPAPAWFRARRESVDECRRRRDHVEPWIAWLVQIGAAPGDVVVCTDDATDRTTDLLVACHLAGCGYSVCDNIDQVTARAEAITGDGISVHVVAVESANLLQIPDDRRRSLVEARVAQTVNDPALAARTAYVMPTSGSTGEPKLVHVSHGSLATFCVAATRAYGWGPADTILQCAPLTSDISVEEVFGAALAGAALIRSSAVQAGDLQQLGRDLVACRATIVDLPTALWHLWCEDVDAMAAVDRSALRQVVIGGEPIRPGAVDTWVKNAGTEQVSVISSYGPTETTVVVTHLPVIRDGAVVEHGARLRLGLPLVANSVVVAFGEVVVMGAMVADGYLGADSPDFGLVAAAGGMRLRAYSTGDRVTVDSEGYPMFAGRKDALVKISGKRVDTAEITSRIAADPAVIDVAVQLRNGALAVWFETRQTRHAGEDPAVAARIRGVLVDCRVSSFVVSGVASIPRKPNGKPDTARLHTSIGRGHAPQIDADCDERAAALAEIWGAHLERVIRPDTSLLHEGIGSLDLVRILPGTRAYLGRQVSILDLISADTAANLVDDMAMTEGWMDLDTAAEIERDFAALATPHVGAVSNRAPAQRNSESVLVVGASGILGTGFAEAILELAHSGVGHPDVVFAMRSAPPASRIWAELRRAPGVRIEHLVPGFGPPELETLIRETGARTVVNCIGNTNVLVPYRELRSANVESVAATVQACTACGTGLVQLSTYVVNADVCAPQVVDPRQAPYPYAATKALAELAVARTEDRVDFAIVRLPRILGTAEQVRGSADILVSIVDACHALGAYPAVELTEEVTTGRAAATSILRGLPGFGGSDGLGCGIEVLRGQAVRYNEFLGTIGRHRVDVDEWKRRVDESDWAKANPRRWSVIDAWIGLGVRLAGRSYAEYLADFPELPLGIRCVGELSAPPPPLHTLLAQGYSPELDTVTRRPINQPRQ